MDVKSELFGSECLYGARNGHSAREVTFPKCGGANARVVWKRPYGDIQCNSGRIVASRCEGRGTVALSTINGRYSSGAEGPQATRTMMKHRCRPSGHQAAQRLSSATDRSGPPRFLKTTRGPGPTMCCRGESNTISCCPGGLERTFTPHARSEKSTEVWAQATASAAVGAPDGRRVRIGCLFQYVSDRQHHSRGPNR
jgi:hypothetical protein